MTGSMANFNWTAHSDIDLHLIVDFVEIGEDPAFVQDYFKLAKSLWNDDHQVEICDHEVEIYVQNSKEPHYSSGVYSIAKDQWLKKPTSGSVVDTAAMSFQKYNDFVEKIDRLELRLEDGEDVSAAVDHLRRRLKKLRAAGLAQDGETSQENLVFKKLRVNGHLDRLAELSHAAYDTKMSIQSC